MVGFQKFKIKVLSFINIALKHTRMFGTNLVHIGFVVLYAKGGIRTDI